eukprot:6043836-Amphidinium_carterae.2
MLSDTSRVRNSTPLSKSSFYLLSCQPQASGHNTSSRSATLHNLCTSTKEELISHCPIPLFGFDATKESMVSMAGR